MKRTQYFTPQLIDRISRQMKDEVADFSQRHKIELRPGKSALLVLDMQQIFLDEFSHAFIPSMIAIIPRVFNLVQSFSRHGLPVIFTRHINSTDDAQMMSSWWNDLIKEEDPFSQISPEFNLDDLTVINKSQYDAFYRTNLEEMLHQLGVRQLVICGVMTHLCCESTARSAFVRGFEVLFTIDGTAAYTEAFHRATLLNLAHGFAVPVLASDILSALGDKIEE